MLYKGCSLSGMIYTLSLEPLLHKVFFAIKGLNLPDFNTRVVFSAHADDVIVIVKCQNYITRLGGSFGEISAVRVNCKE